MQIDCRVSKVWRVVALAGVVGMAASWSMAGPGKPKAAVVQPAPKVAQPAPVAPPAKSPAAAKVGAIRNEAKQISGRHDQASGLRGVGNDECSGALNLGNANPAAMAFDNNTATTGLDGQNNPSCDQYGDGAGIGNDEWFKWTSPVTGTAILSTCGGTSFDTKMAVYSGATCPPGTPIGCNDDACGVQTSVAFAVTTGQVYLFQVGKYLGGTPGSGTATVTASAGFPCDSATTIVAGATTVDNTGIPGTANPPFSCTGAGVGPKWLKFVATATTAVVKTCNSPGPGADSTIGVYAGPCGPGMTEIGCNDDACGGGNGWLSNIVVEGLTVGNTYFIQFCTYGAADQGAYTLELVMPAPPACALVPATGTPEGEPAGCGLAGDTYNGGCNSAPPVFSNIACGQTILGTVGNNGATRDTDWYQLVLTAPSTTVNFAVSTQFPGLAGIVDNNNGIPDCTTIPGTFRPGYVLTAGDCSVAAPVIDTLGPGTWWFFVGTSGFSGTPCGSIYGHYSATLTFTGGCPVTGPDCFTRGAAGVIGSGCQNPMLTHARPQANGHYARGGADGSADTVQCIGDWDGDGCVAPADVAGFVVAWFYSANNVGNLDGDIDCDGFAVPSDVAIFVQHWFNGLNTPATEGCV